MKKLFSIFAAVIAFSIAQTPAYAEKANSDVDKSKASVKAAKMSPIEEKLLTKFKKKYPSTQVVSVRKAEISGLYEVVMGKNIAYVDSDAKYFLFGHVFDMDTQRDLTQERIDDMNRIDFSSLPFEKAIKFVKGNGARTFAVFSDPDCPFCRKLEESLADVDNYTMYVFMNPITQLHPEAESHANAIWCASDRNSAWKNYMLQGKLPEAVAANCTTPVAELISLAQDIGVQGTPTLFRADGARAPGYMPAPQLNDWLNGKQIQGR